ncbi:MAG: ANTAR domain-containing response regulator [Lachnospiraceae bacterium]
MTNVIVAFQKPEHAKSIKNILMRSGFQVIAVCNSGAQTLAYAEGLNSGIVICGYQLPDMLFAELHDCLPREFTMLLISSPAKWGGRIAEDIVCLPMPLKVHDLVEALELLDQRQVRSKRKKRQQPKQRSEEEQALLAKAKMLLMDRNQMTEEEAHRYIQKSSMDSGTDLLETAQMVISLMK